MAYNPRDSYYKKAKQEGYRSRAAYKLLELQQRYRLLKPGDTVVDLGAAPGGWLQVAAKIVGQTGKIIGVDLQTIEPSLERTGRLCVIRFSAQAQRHSRCRHSALSGAQSGGSRCRYPITAAQRFIAYQEFHQQRSAWLYG